MKFTSALSIIAVATVGQVECTRLHSLERAQAKEQMQAMSEQMTELKEKIEADQQSLVEMQSWWNSLWGDVKSVFWEAWF